MGHSVLRCEMMFSCKSQWNWFNSPKFEICECMLCFIYLCYLSCSHCVGLSRTCGCNMILLVIHLDQYVQMKCGYNVGIIE